MPDVRKLLETMEVTTRDDVGDQPIFMTPDEMGTKIEYKCPGCKKKIRTSETQTGLCPNCGEVMMVNLDRIPESKADELLQMVEEIEMQDAEQTDIDVLLDTLNKMHPSEKDFDIADATFDYDNYKVSIQLNQPAPSDVNTSQIADIFGATADNVKIDGTNITITSIGSANIPEAIETDEGFFIRVGEDHFMVEGAESMQEMIDCEIEPSDLEEGYIKVVRGGKVKQLMIKPHKKKILTAKQKAAMAKARKKAWSAQGRKARALSMKKRNQLGL